VAEEFTDWRNELSDPVRRQEFFEDFESDHADSVRKGNALLVGCLVDICQQAGIPEEHPFLMQMAMLLPEEQREEWLLDELIHGRVSEAFLKSLVADGSPKAFVFRMVAYKIVPPKEADSVGQEVVQAPAQPPQSNFSRLWGGRKERRKKARSEPDLQITKPKKRLLPKADNHDQIEAQRQQQSWLVRVFGSIDPKEASP